MSYDVIRHAIDHSEDEVEAEIINDDVEIIEAPYPENGKAQIPKRSFIYDDEDGYPQDYFEHHGILGMKWGVRRYQNKDGSLTPEGARHYAKKMAKNNERIRSEAVNRQWYANKAAEESKRMMEAYGHNEKYRSKSPTEQVHDIRKVRVMGELHSGWKGYEHESDQRMMNAEFRYDDYVEKLLKKFGATGMKQIRAANTDDLYEKSEKYLKEQTSLREVYKELQRSMDEIENEYYNRLSDEEKKKLMYR